MFGIGIPELVVILLIALILIVRIIWDRKFFNYIFRKSNEYKALEYETNKFGGLPEMERELERRITVLEKRKNEIVVKLHHLDTLISKRAEGL